MPEHDHDHPSVERAGSTRVARDRRKEARRIERAHEGDEWTREQFFRDLRRASRRTDAKRPGGQE